MDTHKNGKIIVIGGGIVGLMAAFQLQNAGYQVTVLERGDVRESCSTGNAGMIVPSHFTPLAAPGIVSQGIRWMFKKRSPFYLKPSLSSSSLSWGMKFLKHANALHVASAAPHIRDLNLLGKNEYQLLSKQPGFDFQLKNRGILMLCKQESTLESEIALASQAKALGLDCKPLTEAQVQALEPEVPVSIAGALHYTCDSHLTPMLLIDQLAAAFTRVGGKLLEHETVTDIELNGSTISAVYTEKGKLVADQFVLTGGAWLPKLAKMVNLSIPIMPGKGYSFITQEFKGKLQIPSLLIEDRVAITPMKYGVRVGGTMELAPINSRISQAKIEGIVQAVSKYYPEHDIRMPGRQEIWLGFRPCSPDGLPYLGRSKKVKNLIIAGGAGMMGLSTGPAMGKLIKEILLEEPLSMDIKAFDPQRFH